MKKLILVTALAAISFSVLAEEKVVLTKASATYIQEALTTCKAYAIEDEVPAKELNKYLLQCINDDLEENNYELITALPKIN
jgi:hypothetical protein